jgi:hypothetical protein
LGTSSCRLSPRAGCSLREWVAAALARHALRPIRALQAPFSSGDRPAAQCQRGASTHHGCGDSRRCQIGLRAFNPTPAPDQEPCSRSGSAPEDRGPHGGSA